MALKFSFSVLFFSKAFNVVDSFFLTFSIDSLLASTSSLSSINSVSLFTEFSSPVLVLFEILSRFFLRSIYALLLCLIDLLFNDRISSLYLLSLLVFVSVSSVILLCSSSLVSLVSLLKLLY